MSNSIFICHFCNHNFTQKHNLEKHLNDKKCKSKLLNNWDELNCLLDELHQLKSRINISNSPIIVGNNNYNNIKIEININPITKLDVSHIKDIEMKNLIKSYDDTKYKNKDDTDNNDKDRLNLVLSNYIKNMICDSEHPENHAVKYVKKKPPTYNAITEDSEGNTVNVIKGLKETCELLSDPILDQLKLKLKECIQRYKKDDDPNFDFSLYEDAFKELKKELKKSTVKKALSSVLQNDILENIEMKFTMNETLNET
jgi:hypothetical protein